MLDTLEITQEGSSEAKRARINFLTQEYELFHVKQGENIGFFKTSKLC